MVTEVTDATFESAVLERSKTIPVVVDLWAPWCGPCRQLTPILEKVADARADDFELVKVNVDENVEIATMLGARSIPLVIGFVDGSAVRQFVGAQPESAVNAFIDSLQPSETEKLMMAAAEAASHDDMTRAEALLRDAIAADRQHPQAHVALARVLGERQAYDEALEILARFTSPEAKRLAAAYQLKAAPQGDLEELAAKWRAAPLSLATGID